MNTKRIRPLALALIWSHDRLLLSECTDHKTNNKFYRPLGGGIEWGETGAEAVRRELMEEIDSALENVVFMAMVENIFTYDGEMGHEIVLLFRADLANADRYENAEVIEGVENTDEPLRAVWKPLSFFKTENAPPLYPGGLLTLLESSLSG